MPDDQEQKRQALLDRIIMLVTPSAPAQPREETPEEKKRREEQERDRAEQKKEMDRLLGN